MNNRSNTKQALWVGIGYLGTFLVALGSAMVLSRFLSKEDYGTYRQIIYLQTMLQGVFSAGLPAAYSYFLPKLTLSQGKKLAKILLISFFILGSLMSAMFYIAAPILSSLLDNPNLTSSLRLFSPIPLFLIPTLGIEGLFTAVRQTEKLLEYNIMTKFFMFLCLISPVIILDKGIEGIIYGWIISALFSFLMALYYKNKPFMNINEEKLPFKIIEIFKYTLPIMLTSYVTVLQKSADQFFISRYYGEASFAEYSNGFFEIPFVGMIIGSVSAVMMPIFASVGDDKFKMISAVNSWRNAMEKSVYLIYPLLCFCFITSGQLIMLIYGSKYEASILYFKFALFLNFFNVVLLNSIITSLGKTKFYLYSNLICAVVIWVSKYVTVLLTSTPYVIAFVSVLNSILLIIVPYIYLQKILYIKLMSFDLIKKIFKIILLSFISALIASVLTETIVDNEMLLLSLIIKAFLFSIVYLSLLYILKDLQHYKFLLKLVR